MDLSVYMRNDLGNRGHYWRRNVRIPVAFTGVIREGKAGDNQIAYDK